MVAGSIPVALACADKEPSSYEEANVVNGEAIREMLNRRPFEPFEVVVSSGERHLVKHPEFAILMSSRVIVTDPVADRAAVLSLKHVTELHPAQSQPSA